MFYSETQPVGVDGRGSTEQTCSAAVPERRDLLVGPFVSVGDPCLPSVPHTVSTSWTPISRFSANSTCSNTADVRQRNSLPVFCDVGLVVALTIVDQRSHWSAYTHIYTPMEWVRQPTVNQSACSASLKKPTLQISRWR